MHNTIKENPLTEDNETKNLTKRFVEALCLETQTGEVIWRFQDGYGTPAHCICEGRELTVVPDYSDPDADGYTLYSADIEGKNSCLLMGAKSLTEVPNQLRNLYQDISESISCRSQEPAISHMEGFMRKSAERQCLYSIMDAVKLLHRTITNNMNDIY